MDRFKKECAKLKKKGVKVKLVTSRVLDDYAGMNPRAAKDMHFNGCPKDAILIRRDLSLRDKDQTLRHEVFEQNEMKRNGGKYYPAHKKAMRKIG